MGMYDFEKMEHNEYIYTCFKVLSIFIDVHKKLPENWSIKDSELFIELLKK